MRALCLTVLLLASPAFAFDVGDTVYAKASTPSTRFADAEAEGPTFDKEARLTVLVAEGDRLRVMAPGGTFGWIASAAVTDEGPKKQDIDLEALLKSMEGVDLSTGGGGLGVGGALPPPPGAQ